jgi:hypothetical protein
VRHKAKKSTDKKDESDVEPFELLSPQFTGEVALPSDISAALAAGQRAQISFTPQGESIGDYLFSRFQHWCREKVRRARYSWNL